MKSLKHVIYIPGLGDNRSSLQNIAVKLWSRYGLTPHFQEMNWSDKEPYKSKFERLLNNINLLMDTGTVSLVGTSAGASVALNAFAENPENISKVVTICGKINHPETVQESRILKNPAFKESINNVSASLKKLNDDNLNQILNVKPLWDEVVPVADAVIAGAHEKTLPTFGHAFSIGYAITLGAGAIANFVKSE